MTKLYCTIIPTREEALASAEKNLGQINNVCAAVGMPALTAEEAVRFYYLPNPAGNSARDFAPMLPDLGANNAGAFGDIHSAKWNITVLVTCGPDDLKRAGDACDAAFEAWRVVAPAVQAVARGFSGLVTR